MQMKVDETKGIGGYPNLILSQKARTETPNEATEKAKMYSAVR